MDDTSLSSSSESKATKGAKTVYVAGARSGKAQVQDWTALDAKLNSIKPATETIALIKDQAKGLLESDLVRLRGEYEAKLNPEAFLRKQMQAKMDAVESTVKYINNFADSAAAMGAPAGDIAAVVNQMSRMMGAMESVGANLRAPSGLTRVAWESQIPGAHFGSATVPRPRVRKPRKPKPAAAPAVAPKKERKPRAAASN